MPLPALRSGRDTVTAAMHASRQKKKTTELRLGVTRLCGCQNLVAVLHVIGGYFMFFHSVRLTLNPAVSSKFHLEYDLPCFGDHSVLPDTLRFAYSGGRRNRPDQGY